MRVLVSSDQALVAGTVRRALAAHGHEVTDSPPADVGLLLCDLDRWSAIRAATCRVQADALPWVVLTPAPPGASWGALLEAGVALVLGDGTGLTRLEDALVDVAAGRQEGQVGAGELVAAWHALRLRHDEVTRRVGLLGPHEREVLQLLHEGKAVGQVAEMLEITTVVVGHRLDSSQRKLDVRGPREALAAFAESLDLIEA